MLHMSAINGAYRHEPSDVTLVITEGDDRTGSFTGKLSLSGIDYPIAYGNFHFKHGFSNGVVAITFSTRVTDGRLQAWVLFSADQRYGRLRAMGSGADLAGSIAMTGLELVRQDTRGLGGEVFACLHRIFFMLEKHCKFRIEREPLLAVVLRKLTDFYIRF
jgi:hypothetical protein